MKLRSDIEKKVGDLTVLEFQDFLWDLNDDDGTLDRLSPKPEEIDLANKIGDLPLRKFITVMKHSLPRGEPREV